MNFKLKNATIQQKIEELDPSFKDALNKACNARWYADTRAIVIKGSNLTCIFNKSEIERIDPLLPYVWYDVSRWQGAVNDYYIVEDTGEFISVISAGILCFKEKTKRFMLIPMTNRDGSYAR